MDRRRALAVLASVATGGCLGGEVPSQSHIRRGVASFTDRGHPYQNEVLTVGIAGERAPDATLAEAIEAATTYWEQHAPRFAGFPVSYSLDFEAPSPAVEIKSATEIDHCGDQHSASIAGCAPRVTAETVRPSTATIRIESGLEEPFLTRVLKHEFGHTLGLDHQDEPQHVMSSNPETWVPQYETRKQIVDEYTDAVEQHNAAIEAYDDGTEQFNRDAFDAAIDQYDQSVAAVGSARQALDRVVTAASEIDASGVVTNARDSRSTISALATSAEYLTEAAAAYDRGNFVAGQRKQQQHTTAYESFEEGTFHPASTIIRQLGMPADTA